MARVDVIGITSDESLVLQAITDGTYFVENGAPTGAIDGANTAFTLASNPSPDSSLRVYLNGARLKVTTDYSLSGTTLTLVTAPPEGSILTVDYRFSPV